MKVLVIGAGESAGELVIKRLNDRSHHTVTFVNNENRLRDMRDIGADEVILTDNGRFTNTFPEGDVVIYVAGASPRSGEEKTTLVDHTAVIDAVKESKRSHIKRFILLSAVRASETTEADQEAELPGAKAEPEEVLRQEDLLYTIFRPGLLVSKPGKGKVSAKIASPRSKKEGELSVEDAADVLVAAMEQEATYNQTIELTSGTTSIREALQSL